VAAKKAEAESEIILAELRAQNPDFDKEADEFAAMLLGFDDDDTGTKVKGGGQAPVMQPSGAPPGSEATLAACISKMDRELASAFGSSELYSKYLKYREHKAKGYYLGSFTADEKELFTAVEANGFEAAKEIVRQRHKTILNGPDEAEVDLVALASGSHG